MKKLVLAVGIVLLLGADKADDAKKLEGKWVVKSAERGGKPVDLDKEEHIPQSLTFKGDKITMAGKGREHSGTCKLGRDDKLHTMDLTPDDADSKDRVMKALYSLKDDTLTICVNEGKLDDRPKEISAKEGSHCAVVIFTREKAK
jgi:uncharacterized protein (TIGR03067 family)